MLRMYCLQQWYGLADEALEGAARRLGHRPVARIDARRYHAAEVQATAAGQQPHQGAILGEQCHHAEQRLLIRAATIVEATIACATKHHTFHRCVRDPRVRRPPPDAAWNAVSVPPGQMQITDSGVPQRSSWRP
ncbi:hypothetical protein [Variovorax sp. WS11]|uniref:hypothetical protein n=1 Tax=Variovorax sp. WS11 TaxID=1105204 RepID=UPI0035BF221D